MSSNKKNYSKVFYNFQNSQASTKQMIRKLRRSIREMKYDAESLKIRAGTGKNYSSLISDFVVNDQHLFRELQEMKELCLQLTEILVQNSSILHRNEASNLSRSCSNKRFISNSDLEKSDISSQYGNLLNEALIINPSVNESSEVEKTNFTDNDSIHHCQNNYDTSPSLKNSQPKLFENEIIINDVQETSGLMLDHSLASSSFIMSNNDSSFFSNGNTSFNNTNTNCVTTTDNNNSLTTGNASSLDTVSNRSLTTPERVANVLKSLDAQLDAIVIMNETLVSQNESRNFSTQEIQLVNKTKALRNDSQNFNIQAKNITPELLTIQLPIAIEEEKINTSVDYTLPSSWLPSVDPNRSRNSASSEILKYLINEIQTQDNSVDILSAPAIDLSANCIDEPGEIIDLLYISKDEHCADIPEETKIANKKKGLHLKPVFTRASNWIQRSFRKKIAKHVNDKSAIK